MTSRLFLLVLLLTFFLSSAQPTYGARHESGTTAQQPAGSVNQDPETARLEVEITKLYKAGKYDEALPLAKQVLKIRERSSAPNDPALANSMGNLATIYIAKGKFGDADSLLKRALEIYRLNPDKNAFLIAKTFDSLGHVKLFKSDLKKAEQYYLQGLVIKEQTASVDDSEVIYSLNNLSDVYNRQKDLGKSNAMLERIITIKEKKLGASDTEVGRWLERLACQMYRNNQTAEAEKIEARANHILYSALLNDPDPISLPNDVFACKLVNNPRPDFRMVAHRYGGTARMDISVETDEFGNVTSATYVGGDPVFKSVSEKAARNAKLRPTIVDGRGVKVKGIITHMITTTMRVVAVPVMVPGRQ